MEKKSFNLFYFVILISGVLYTNVCFSQNTPTTWQDRLEALKNSFNEENRGDVSFLMRSTAQTRMEMRFPSAPA